MDLTTFYTPLRTLLGDRQVHGAWNYQDADLLSALTSVFTLGRAPAGFTLAGTAITPDMTAGADLATVCYHAVIMLVSGEDGAYMIKTRSMEIRDEGNRKRDLLLEMRQRLYDIESGGGFVFDLIEDFRLTNG